MKFKSIFLILIVPIFGFSKFDMEQINKVLSSIKMDNKKVELYSPNFKFMSKLYIDNKTKQLDRANIVIFPTPDIKDKITIVDSKDRLKKDKNSIGAIFVKKGRTQIIFVKERLDKKKIKILLKDKEKEKEYVIKECFLKNLCLSKYLH
jgi:hypothetical protein